MSHTINSIIYTLFFLSILACKKPSTNTATKNTSKPKIQSNNIAVSQETKPIQEPQLK